MKSEDYQRWYERKNAERIRALEGWDAQRYALLCVDLNVKEPEDTSLFDQGVFETQRRNILDKLAERKYADFLNETRQRGIRVENVFADRELKISVLEKYFPEKFGPDGLQQLGSYTAEKVGVVYKGVVGSALKEEKLALKLKEQLRTGLVGNKQFS